MSASLKLPDSEFSARSKSRVPTRPTIDYSSSPSTAITSNAASNTERSPAIMSQDVDISSGYNDTHRAFLQAFIARQCMTFDQARPLLALILSAESPERTLQPGDISQEDFEAYIHAVNDTISPFDLEIRTTRHQSTNEQSYALVNTTSDTLMQMATMHTADEIAFVRRVLDAMFETYNTLRAEVMAITGMQALKLARPAAESTSRQAGVNGISTAAPAVPLTGTEAEAMMKSMVAQGWFEQTGTGRDNQKHFYVLAPRALMELREWLADTYNVDLDDEDADAEEMYEAKKIKSCAACREIVTEGQRCPRQLCLGRLHDHCSERMFRAQGNQQICPVCSSAWEDYLLVGVKAADAGSLTAAPRARARLSQTTADNDMISDE